MATRKRPPLRFEDIGLPSPEPGAGIQAEIPASFLGFCAWLGVKLEPGQRVAARVAFDGAQPCDLPGEERAICRDLFGDVETVSPTLRRIFLAVCGARGGKTYVLASLRLLHLALTVPIDALAPGEVASGPLIAPDMDLATQALRYIQGAVASKPELAAMVVGKIDASESIEIGRNGRIVEIVVRSASGRGRTGRGRSLIGFAMEESAFFHDKDHQVNDDEIFKALTPRLMPGAQGIISSTPWAQSGLVYTLFVANHPNPKCAGINEISKNERTALAMHATTLRLRDTHAVREMIARERALDPDNAAREYDAQFMSAGINSFFDPITIARCIDASLEIPFLPEAGDQVASGGDLGFTKNSSALVIAHRRVVSKEERDEVTGRITKRAVGLISVADILEKKPEEGVALRPSEVVREFAARIMQHQGSYLMADGHYKETAIEHLASAGLGFFEAPLRPADAFIAARAAMREDRVRFPNHPRLVRQLRETMVRHAPGGTIQIILPRWETGEHGDIAAAMVLAIYQAAGETVPIAKAAEGTPEAHAAQAKAIETKRRDEVRRRHEPGGTFAQKWPGRG